jgi:hypothetical protein
MEIRRQMAKEHPDLRAHLAHEEAGWVVDDVLIGLQLNIGGVRVESTHSHRDPSLPEGTYKVSAGAYELLISTGEWWGRPEELRAHLRS